jgi:hypothetical protein
MISDKHGSSLHRHLNRSIFNCLILSLFTVVILFSGTVQAGEKRQHGTHVHGIATLNIAVEGNSIYIEFSSPSANIVGFGHAPHTSEQKDAVANAVKTLQQGDSLFLLSARSESKLVKSSVDTTIDKEHHGHEEKRDGNHGDADEHERHSEFEAQYQFVCQKPDKLSQIEVMLFRAFPGIEHIDVQLLTESTQTAVELTAKQNKISLF